MTLMTTKSKHALFLTFFEELVSQLLPSTSSNLAHYYEYTQYNGVKPTSDPTNLFLLI